MLFVRCMTLHYGHLPFTHFHQTWHESVSLGIVSAPNFETFPFFGHFPAKEQRRGFGYLPCAGIQFWAFGFILSAKEVPFIVNLFSVVPFLSYWRPEVHQFLQGVSIAWYAEFCISYGRVFRPSVCLSVRLSHAGTVSKRRKLGSRDYIDG